MMAKQKKKSIFTGTQREILKKMIACNRPLTAYELSKKTGRTWKTAKTNLDDLKKIKAVERVKRKNVSYWDIRKKSKKK